jgi:hypothetical protein
MTKKFGKFLIAQLLIKEFSIEQQVIGLPHIKMAMK